MKTENTGYGHKIIGYSFVVWGIHKADYPFLRPLDWFAPWGFLISSILELTIALGIFIFYFQKTQFALQISEKRFRSLVESMRETFWIVSQDWKQVFYMSPAFEEIWGKSADLLNKDPMSWFKTVVDEDKPAVLNVIDKLKNGCFTATIFPEFRIVSPDGSIRWISCRAYPNVSDSNEVLYYTGIFEDITSRKVFEECLCQRTALLEAQLNSTIDGIIVVNSDGKMILQNQRIAEIWNIPPHIIKTEDDEEKVQYIRQMTKDPQKFVNKIAYLYNHPNEICQDELELKNGKILDRYSAPVLGKDGKYYGRIWVFRDITENKLAAEEILKSRKLESISILAQGIAHNFNNALLPIVGNISLVKTLQEFPENINKIFIDMDKAAKRLDQLTQQFLVYAKGEDPKIEETDTITLVKDTISFSIIETNVSYCFDLPSDLWHVKIDKRQFSQVIQNLVINAAQAMPEGGTIKIKGENINVPLNRSSINSSLQEGNYVKLSIIDQGIGIAEDQLPKIFDPYFTTRQKGGGLGLSIAYSIIKKHNGLITADSKVGSGTTLTLYLPAITEVTISEQQSIPSNEIKTGKGSILLLEDDEIVRTVIVSMLERLGYQVDFAKEGSEILDKYKKHKESNEPYDIVILDLIISEGMGGKETIEKLKKYDPSVKCIVSSGYSLDPYMCDYQKYGFSGVIPKPYQISELSNVLNTILHKK